MKPEIKWRCGECYAIIRRHQWRDIEHPLGPAYDVITFCPHCGEAWGKTPMQLCDVPDCTEAFAYGTPGTKEASTYRMTCAAHRPKGTWEEENAA